MIKSFKVMLVPNNEQRTRLFQFAGTARFAYNWALNKEMTAFENGENFISIGTLRKEFTLIRNSAKYSWLFTISNNVTKQAIKDLRRAFQNYFSSRGNYPKFKKKNKSKISFYQRVDNFRKVDENHVKLTGIKSPVKIKKQNLDEIKTKLLNISKGNLQSCFV